MYFVFESRGYVALVSIRSVIMIVVNFKIALYLAFRLLKSRA